MTGEQELGMWPPARCINISQSQCHGLTPAVSTLKSLVREHERLWGLLESAIQTQKCVVDLGEKK